jgi:hypothetical protein
MIRADENIVQSVLRSYEDAIFKAVHGAWSDWRELPLGGRLLFPGRTRACLVHDFMVQRAIAAWTGDSAVRVIRRDETAKFVVAGQVLLRFKKADDRGLGSNIPTQAALDFAEQQHELPGIPNVHKIEVVYALNRLQTQIDRVVVVARDGDAVIWDYPIVPVATAEVIMLPTQTSESPKSARVRVRKTDEADKKKDGSE